MIELPTLYEHQTEVTDRTRSALAKNRRVILCAPPGMGKTRCSKWILGSSANREPASNQSGRSLFAVHRRGLVDNAVHSFSEEPRVDHGIVMSGHKPNWKKRIQIASIDTILSWFVGGKVYESEWTFDLIAFDETHSNLPKLRKFLEAHDKRRKELGLHPAYVIGLTATPQCEGLSDVYREIVPGPSTQWLIDNGYLSGFRYFRATSGKLDLLKKRGGEFTNTSHAAAMAGLAGDLVRDWKHFAEGRPTVGFFPRRSHAKEAMQELESAGLRVKYIDGDTKDEERHEIFSALNNHEIDYLCNVQVVERGTDIPAIACVQMCVAVASVPRWRQMIGRGSRVHPSKTDCLVLDHGGNLARGMGFFEDDPHWTLDIRTKETGEVAPRPTIACPNCKAIYRGGECRSCGYRPTAKERLSQGLEFDGSELKEVKPTATKKKVKTAHDLMVSSLYRAGKSGKTWKQAVGLFYRESEKQGTNYRVPKAVEVAGQEYPMLRHGSLDGGRYVRDLFPFTVEPRRNSNAANS